MRKYLGVMLVTCAIGLTACGSSTVAIDSTTDSLSFTINKDGSISNSIVEEFGESYYDEDSLKTMIDSAISEYNDDLGTKISLKTCKVSNGYANVTIEYDNYRAYSGFNDESFFAGTITEANMAGYDLNVTLTDASDSSVTVSKPQLLGMGDNHIVIIEAEKAEDGAVINTVHINTFDEILYVSNGITKTGKKSADMNLSSGNGIIVFK
jgi:hypothetical protein